MNKIDELFDEMQGLNIEIEDKEAEMTPQELERIIELTLQKADFKSEKKPLYKKKRPLFIAAAVLIALLSLSIMASERVVSFFQELLGINYGYVSGNEKVIQKSDTQKGITVTIKEIIGDERNVWIIYDITKDNGEAFKSDEVRFDSVGVNFPYSGGGRSERQISYDKSSVITRLMHIDTTVPIHGKSGSMIFLNLIEEAKNEALFELDISKFLKEHPELIHQAPILNTERASGDPQEPEYILPSKGLDILLSSCIPDTKLDNIGFIDGRLHMRLKSTYSELDYFGRMEEYDDIFFKDENQSIEPIHESGHGCYNGMYTYLIYEIKDVKTLENLKPYAIYPYITKGKWEIPFTMDYTYSSKKITPNVLYNPKNKENKCMIKEVTLSPMSLSVFIEGNIGDQDQKHGPEIEIFFKDGSKAGRQSTLISNEEERTIINSSFFYPIDMKDVEYITINNQKIKMSGIK